MTPLAELLKQQIRATGPITVEEYMEACLYHPLHGYYTNGHNFLPAPTSPHSLTPNPLTPSVYPHDFTTAPELTHLFGATLANWLVKEWQALGQPTPFTLMECGPGRGTLMHALLTHLKTSHQDCYAAAIPTLIEVSPALTRLQKQTLIPFPQTQWSTTPITTASPIILIANELLDAFPHSQIIVQDGRIQPRTIELNKQGELTFTQTHPEQMTEHSPQMRTWLQALPQNVMSAIFLDYGIATEEATGDTFQAIHKHQKVSVFHRPGESDLTNHVNFHNLNTALSESHPHLHGQTLQPLATFLLSHGLASLALAQAPHPTTETTLHRLLHPKQMGTLFQVKCYYTSRP